MRMLPASGQNSSLAYRHDMNIRLQATSQSNLDETRRQLRDTGINIRVPDSNMGNDTESCCDQYLFCLAVCVMMCFCILTGALAVLFAYRRQKYLEQGNRSAANASGAVAIVLIVLSVLFVAGCILYIILSKN